MIDAEEIDHEGARRRTKNAHFNRENKSLLRDPSRPFVGNFDFELNGMSYSKAPIASKDGWVRPCDVWLVRYPRDPDHSL
jgi:hypothetical protein